MGLLTIPNTVPRSSQTRRQAVAIFQETLNDYGGVDLDTMTLRTFLNMGVTKAATLVRKVDPDVYRTVWTGTLDYEPAISNNKPYGYLDLKTVYVQTSPNLANGEQSFPTLYGSVGMSPWGNIHRLEYVGVDEYTPTKATADANLWRGLAEEVTYPQFSAIANGLNDQWRQSCIWTLRNGRIEFFVGADVVAAGAWEPNERIQLTLLRKPILDTLKTPDNVDNNLDTAIDIPDEALPLVIEYAKNLALASRGKQVDPTIAQAEQLMEQSFLMTFGNYAPNQQQ